MGLLFLMPKKGLFEPHNDHWFTDPIAFISGLWVRAFKVVNICLNPQIRIVILVEISVLIFASFALFTLSLFSFICPFWLDPNAKHS